MGVASGGHPGRDPLERGITEGENPVCDRGVVDRRTICYFEESGCSGLQSEMGGNFHLKLNTGERPIANKYCEGKMKRTLKRELKVLEIVKKESFGSSLRLTGESAGRSPGRGVRERVAGRCFGGGCGGVPARLDHRGSAGALFRAGGSASVGVSGEAPRER